ncbi:MotE family protein [Dethiothermospora halolimnae]|uniref:MotE family protein n=1 Tax=Dethiothermospora halolimnae TaxID=3114390 RepID=UPI003CCBD2ED
MAKGEKKLGVGKGIILFILFLIVLSLITLTITYAISSNFKKRANKILTKVPGVVGEHFESIPTDEEKKNQLNKLASYYGSLDIESATDKLYIIKQEDEELFNDIKDTMVDLSSTYKKKAGKIIEEIRQIELRGNSIFALYEEIEEEENNKYIDKAKSLGEKTPVMVLEEIRNTLNGLEGEPYNHYVKEMGRTFGYMEEDKAKEILYFLDENFRKDILRKISDEVGKEKAQTIDNLIDEKKANYNNLLKVSEVYENKQPTEAYKDIGSTDKYNVESLANIYMNLSPEQSAKILLQVRDDELVNNLFNKIINLEELFNKDTSITPAISAKLKELKKYDENVKELVATYERMEPGNVADIIDNMINDNPNMVLDILREMKRTKLSQVLKEMEAEKASNISKMLLDKEN